MSNKTKHCIRIPTDCLGNFPHGVVYGLGEAAKQLRTKRCVDVVNYSVPGIEGDVLRRIMVVSKAPKSDLIEAGVDIADIPDFGDLLQTNLPWAGHVTFDYASRQFRSKNALSVACEVLREIDGYVYRLSVNTGVPPESRLPCLFEMVGPNRLNPFYKITIETEPSDKVAAEILLAAPLIPMALVDELKPLGYDIHGQTFMHASGIKGRDINVTLFGKVANAS